MAMSHRYEFFIWKTDRSFTLVHERLFYFGLGYGSCSFFCRDAGALGFAIGGGIVMAVMFGCALYQKYVRWPRVQRLQDARTTAEQKESS